MDDQKYEEAKSQFFWTWALTFLAFSTAFLCIKLKQARHRASVERHTPCYIEREKIIIALEVNQFFVRYSHRREPGYLPLSIEDNEVWLVRLFKQVFKFGHFYKPLFGIAKIKDFIQGMADIPKVELVLYSSLPPPVADAILVQLQIDRFLPLRKRKFCDLENNDDQKHAIQVDQDSRRVVIITPSYSDHTYEDEKYFLVLKPKTGELNFLRDSLRSIKCFVEGNSDLNMLHDELGDFKINVESDWSESQY